MSLHIQFNRLSQEAQALILASPVIPREGVNGGKIQAEFTYMNRPHTGTVYMRYLTDQQLENSGNNLTEALEQQWKTFNPHYSKVFLRDDGPMFDCQVCHKTFNFGENGSNHNVCSSCDALDEEFQRTAETIN